MRYKVKKLQNEKYKEYSKKEKMTERKRQRESCDKTWALTHKRLECLESARAFEYLAADPSSQSDDSFSTRFIYPNVPERRAPTRKEERERERTFHSRGSLPVKFSRNLSPPHFSLPRNTAYQSLSGPDRSDDLNIAEELGRCLRNHLGSSPLSFFLSRKRERKRPSFPLNCRRLSSRYARLFLQRARSSNILAPLFFPYYLAFENNCGARDARPTLKWNCAGGVWNFPSDQSKNRKKRINWRE